MGTLQRNLFIVFRELQPELLFQSMSVHSAHGGANRLGMSAEKISNEVFQSVAHSQYPSYSYEEICHIYNMLVEDMKPIAEHVGTASSVFQLLLRMGKRIFWERGGNLVCRFSEVLAWQNVYHNLGQDIFTTSYLAFEDLRCGHPPRSEFTWAPIIKTDNIRLNSILQNGIAENHCHLGGTSQNFPISWACLMNYPNTIKSVSKQFNINLQSNLSRGTVGNVWPWEKRLLWACYLRLELFKILEGSSHEGQSLNMEDLYLYPSVYVRQELRSLVFTYGARVPLRDGSTFVLDYALRGIDCKTGLLKNHNRLLSGERSFLYRCFRACFDGTFDSTLCNWFYMYLLIKEHFRSELIQVNRQAGFKNFKDYQDRKDAIFSEFPGYEAEAVRLSVNANLQNQNMTGFEVRIAPNASPAEMQRQIEHYDNEVVFASSDNFDKKHYYVYHFIKSPDSNDEKSKIRNFKVRKNSEIQARALHYALLHLKGFEKRVVGIDAANIEIGCRPEVFAVPFRYLRDIKPLPTTNGLIGSSTSPNIHTTYHVGEDFLDIADGLRAIDEAVKFLNLERGDRLGHALALGVDPSVHYFFKKKRVLLQKQDLLDNVVWLLYRSQELGVEVSPRLNWKLTTIADQYLSEIYGSSFPNENLSAAKYEYYRSMLLRGDAPELYFVLPFEEPKYMVNGSYRSYFVDSNEELCEYRKSPIITALYQRYHFSSKVREKGAQVVEFCVDDEYISFIGSVQTALAQEIANKGISVESNPTSNYLIGTFGRYDSHPIFRFNNVGLVRRDGVFEHSFQIHVSVNTDDLGVFDTSLENEYVVLAAALSRATVNGEQKYTEDSIYAYLDNLRRMGLEQSFGCSREKKN